MIHDVSNLLTRPPRHLIRIPAKLSIVLSVKGITTILKNSETVTRTPATIVASSVTKAKIAGMGKMERSESERANKRRGVTKSKKSKRLTRLLMKKKIQW